MAEGVSCVWECISVCPSAWQSGPILVVTEARGRGLTHLFLHLDISVATMGHLVLLTFSLIPGTALLPGVLLASTRT